MADVWSRNVMRSCMVAAALLIATASPAWAHKVNVFATVSDGVIEGEAYFAGGGAAKNCLVEFFDATGRKLGETRTDSDGRFRFQPVSRTDHRIVLNAGEGHRAEYTVSADEIPETPTQSVQQTSQPVSTDVERVVADAVAREIGPLRKQLYRWEQRVRLRDILGGVGYIFGLAGLALYLKSRKGPRTQ